MHSAAPCTPLSSAATGSLKKTLQNIKIFASAPFGAGVSSVAELSVTRGRAGGLGWAALSSRSPVYFPSRKALRCWPPWSTASPNGVGMGLHGKHVILPQPALPTSQCLFWYCETAALGCVFNVVSGQCQCIRVKGSSSSKTQPSPTILIRFGAYSSCFRLFPCPLVSREGLGKWCRAVTDRNHSGFPCLSIRISCICRRRKELI